MHEEAIFILTMALVIFIWVPLLLYELENMPQRTAKVSGAIDISQEPLQIPFSGEEFTLILNGVEFTIEPVATYTITFLVVNTRHHYDTPENELCPIDLCVVWGDLAEPENLKFLAMLKALSIILYCNGRMM